MYLSSGQCTGYKQSEIKNFFPPDLHPNTELPRQNTDECGLDMALMKFDNETKRGAYYIYYAYFYIPHIDVYTFM